MEVSELSTASRPLVLLTGTSGYVGGRLLQALQEKQYPVRCFIRRPQDIPENNSHLVSYVAGDVADMRALLRAMEGVDVAFYLIHSMGLKEDFAAKDRDLATQFAQAASRSGVKRIIYLGGLGSSFEELSPHLRSRQEVGHILRANAEGVQVLEFRSSIVIGSGSLSYEMIRALVERLPFMITPKWVYTDTQPIAISDLLNYLVQAIEIDVEGNPILEIGGKDRVSYGDLMREYARQKGLKRWMVRVPVLSPRLSSLWLGLVTPLYARVGRKLVESAACETIVHDPLAAHLFHVDAKTSAMAIAEAIQGETTPETRWNDAQSASTVPYVWPNESICGRIVDTREAIVDVAPEIAFKPIRRIGGNQGYYFGDLLWWLRGLVDVVLGGVGLRRGRRDPETLRPGDVVDFWRVETFKPANLLRLQAEMKLPGRAWLEFHVTPHLNGSKITQKAIFDPAGTLGILYWYLLYPFHSLVFKGMLRGIVSEVKK